MHCSSQSCTKPSKWWYGLISITGFVVLVHMKTVFLHCLLCCNPNSIQIQYFVLLKWDIPRYAIATNFFTCHDSTAAAACAIICSYQFTGTDTSLKWNFHWIRNIMEKFWVRRPRPKEKLSWSRQTFNYHLFPFRKLDPSEYIYQGLIT